jgi:preprotein translocase subunit SecG
MAKETPTKKKNKKAAAKSSAKTKSANSVTKSVAPEAVKSTNTTKTTSAAAVKPVTASTPASKLARWYKWLGLIFFVEGLAVVVLNKAVTAPVALQYPAVDALASESNGHQIIGLASRHIADVHLGWVVALFLIVFAAISLALASAYRAYIDVSVKRGVNAFRWLALGVGGGLMVVAIALVSGVSSIALLLALFGATLIGSLLALAAETVVASNDGVKTRFAHVLCGLAVVSSLFPWVLFALGVVGAAMWGGHIPGYLYSIYACQFVLFIAMLLATHFRLKRQGRWADAAYTDRGFLLLTFVAATLLAAQIFAGVLK